MHMLILILTSWMGCVSAGSVMLIGGALRDDNDEIYGKFVELAGGRGRARIGVVTAASGDPQGSADWYIPHFYDLGAEYVYWIPVTVTSKGENRNPFVVRTVETLTGIFFGGGDQARLTASLYNEGRDVSPVLSAMRGVLQRGGVVGGTSAGCVGLSTPVMIMGGMSWEALRYGAYDWNSNPGRDRLLYDPLGGLGFLDGYVLDSHFSERGREGRLVRLASDTRNGPLGSSYALGIDEDTALVITNVGTIFAKGKVIGTNGVYFADLTQSRVDELDGSWVIQNVYTSWLSAGDEINLNTHSLPHRVQLDSSWKNNLIGDEKYEQGITSDNIFDGNRSDRGNSPVYVRVARSILDSRFSVSTWGRTPLQNRPRVDFYQEPGTQGYGGFSPYNGRWMISYSRLRISMGPDM